ncbi:MAG: putative collagen-binding protein, partial [Acidimicrobiales bacterium]|nr:putative collagen-binding protein [Acidimicrobiales bacterium]
MQVHLEPTQATAVPGTALMLTVVVTNDGSTERSCRVRVVGLEAPWVEHSAGELTVPAGSRLEIPIRITLPHGFPRGETLVGVEVQPDGDERPLVADARVSVSDLESLSIGLSPVTVRGGWRGRFKLNVENRGTEPLTIKLSGRGVGPDETKSELEFTFKPEELTLRPGERTKTKGYVSGRRPAFGAPKRRALTVTAQGQTAPRHVQGAFVQRPLMPKNILRVVGLVCVLAMWAGALTTGVRLTSKSAKSETAQNASATADAAAGGASGSGGAGAGGTNGSGTQEAVAPTTGGAIAGQVKGPQDASGVTVAIRPVALADDLSQDITLISSTSEPAKESAQILQREPAGPVGPTATTVTDGDGRWAFGGLKSPANYELTFSKAGFGERTYIVTVNDETPSVALDVPLVSGNGAMAGTIRGPDGPLGGAVVSVTDGAVTFRSTTPTSGDVGTWSVDGLTTPGTYVVTSTLRGYGTESTSITLGSGDSKSGVDLTMAPGVGSISGHISGAGTKLGNIAVSATNGDVTRTATTLTEGDPGSYSLPQLPIPGTYTVSVTGDGWIPQTLSLDLKGNASKVDVDLVRTTATIVGTIKDATGKALASTGVTLAQDKPIVKTLSAIDPAGSYELTGLAPGTYTLSFERADFKTESTIVTVAAGERKSVDSTLTAQVGDKIPKDAVVRGIVRSSTTGNAVSGVQVTTNATTVTTDATGGFTFDKLAPGSYDLAFASARYQPTTRTVRIGAKSDTTIDVTMLTLGGIQGVVSDLTATPIAGVTVTVTNDPAATGQPAFTTTTTTSTSGQFSLLETLTTGKYIATFTKAGYETRARNFEASAGSIATGDTTLIELGSVFGLIQEPNAAVTGGFVALAGATVTLTNLANVPITNPAVSITVDNPVVGQYRIIGLSPGDYKVNVSKAGYQNAPKTLTGIKLREVRDGSVVLNGLPATMSGHVSYIDANGNSQTITGAQVLATIVTGFDTSFLPYIQPLTATRTVTTDVNGFWTIPALSGGLANGPITGTSGSYVASAAGFTTKNVAISTPDNNGDGEIVLSALPRAVSGGVKLAGASGGGTTTVTVTLSGGSLSSPRTLTPAVSNDNTTVAAYSFATPKVPVGSYNLTFSASGYDSITVPIAVLSTGDLTVPDQTLNKLGSIVVTATSGSAVSGATVDLKKNGVTASTLATDVNGQVTFPNLAPTSGSVAYTVTINKGGYAPDTDVVVTVTAGSAAAHNRTLAKWSTLTVHLKSRLDNPGSADTVLAGASVTLQSLDVFGNPAGLTIVPESATPGDYTLPSVAPAPAGYTLAATATGHAPSSQNISPVAGVAHVQTVALLANPRIRVSVVSHQTSTDLALTGATVTATGTTGGPITLTAVSGTPGDYLSPGLAVDTYTINVSATNHVSTAGSVTTVQGTTSPLTRTLNKWPALTVHANSHVGTTDSNLAGAAVSATPVDGSNVTIPGGTVLNFAVTGSGGNTSRSDVPPGRYRIDVTATNHTASSTVVTTVAGDDDQTTTLSLPKKASIALTVQSGGLALAVASVTIDGGSATATDTNGLVTFNQLAAGTYALQITKAGYQTTSRNVTVADGEDATPTQSVLRFTTLTVHLQSKLDALTPALGGATVTVQSLVSGTPTGGLTSVPASGTAGDYVLPTLAPGDYRIAASASGNASDTLDITAVAGTDLTRTIALLADPHIRVSVVSHQTGPTDSALTGATVTATGTSGGPITLTAVSGTPGDYLSPAVGVDTYTINVSATGYVAATGGVTTVQGATATLTRSLDKWPALTVHVTAHSTSDANAVGAALTATPVNLSDVATGPAVGLATTNASGDSLNTDVAPGRYRIDATLAGHDAGFVIATTAAGGANVSASAIINKRPDLQVTAVGRVTVGSPAVDTDSALTNGTVTAACTAGSCGSDSVTLVHQSGGVYLAAALRPGTYTVTLEAPGFTTQAKTGVVLSAGGSQVSLAPAGNPETILAAEAGSITGTVRKLDGSVIPGVTVTAISNGSVSSTTTNASGVYTITGLAPVTWTVSYQLSGYSSLVQSVTVPKGSAFNTGGTATSNTILVELGATMTGKTFGVATTGVATGTTDNPITALDQVVVTLSGAASRQQTVSADGSGNYAYGFSDLPAGTYQIVFTRNGYVTGNVTGISLSTAQVVARQDTLTAKAGSVTVTITSTVGGAAVPGVSLRLESPLLNSGHTSNQSTDSNGQFVFSSLPPGTYNAVVQSAPTGFVLDSTLHAVTLLVSTTTSAPTAVLAFTIVPRGSLQVTVTGLGGTAVSGATVTVTGPTNTSGSTNGSGVATIDNLIPGSYTF